MNLFKKNILRIIGLVKMDQITFEQLQESSRTVGKYAKKQ